MKHALAALLLFALTGCPEEPVAEPASEPSLETPATKDEGRITCPPCGMQTTPPVEATAIGGMNFWVCNDRCAELIRQDPERFAQHALPDTD